MADKSKTIKNATDKELDELIARLRKESEVQSLISDIKRKSGSGYMPYDFGQEISTEKSIESLYHYGVPGMRWGRKKGTSAKPSRFKKKKISEEGYSKDYKKKLKLKKKHPKEMSNEELKELNARMQLENQYNDLNKKQISAGRKFAQDILTEIGKEVAKDLLKKGIKSIGSVKATE